MTSAQILRLIMIDTLAEQMPAGAPFRRAMIRDAFGISVSQAAHDLACFQGLFPDRLEYDPRKKGYLARPGSTPAFPAETRAALGGLWPHIAAAEATIAAAEEARNARQAALSQIDAHPAGAPTDG